MTEFEGTPPLGERTDALQDVSFVNDWGLQIFRRFLRAVGWLALFWLVILIIGAPWGTFSAELRSFAYISLVGLGILILLAAYVAIFDPHAQIEFRGDGIHMDSLLLVKAGFGGSKSIKYDRCKVYERHYWKFTNHYFLVFYDGRKAVFNVSKSSWEKSYDRIKIEIHHRLMAGSFQFENSPEVRETVN